MVTSYTCVVALFCLFGFQVERQKREAEALKRLKEEKAELGKINEQRKADKKEELTLEDWRKEKKGMVNVSFLSFLS